MPDSDVPAAAIVPAAATASTATYEATATEHSSECLCAAAEKSRSPEYSFMLVTSEHCPNCVTVQTVMNNANIQYNIVDVSEYPEVISKYSVRSAPTLIVQNGESFNTYANESNIRAFVTSRG
jgi:ribonucleoside-triphosphate reductase